MSADTPLLRIDGFFQSGPLRLTVKDFKCGEVLPVHTHNEYTNHLTIVASGSLVCRGRPSIEGAVIKAGDVLDWRVGEPHGFEALEDGTRIVQVNKPC